MLTQTIFTTLLAAASAVAAPATALTGNSLMVAYTNQATMFPPANVPDWTIENLKRVCASDDSSCTWDFQINTHVASRTIVKFVVKGPHASQNKAGGPANFGDFTITSGWNPQGFTVLSAVDNKDRLIAFPGYSDAEVQGGKTVANKNFKVYHLDG